jgi:hypothetical protein
MAAGQSEVRNGSIPLKNSDEVVSRSTKLPPKRRNSSLETALRLGTTISFYVGVMFGG